MRGYRVDGMKFGSNESEEGQIFLNSQTWSVLSGAAGDSQAASAMKKVKERLATGYGIMLCDPPYTKPTVARQRNRASCQTNFSG